MSAPVPEINPDRSTEFGGYRIWLGSFGDVVVSIGANREACTPERALILAGLIIAYANASIARRRTGRRAAGETPYARGKSDGKNLEGPDD